MSGGFGSSFGSGFGTSSNKAATPATSTSQTGTKSTGSSWGSSNTSTGFGFSSSGSSGFGGFGGFGAQNTQQTTYQAVLSNDPLFTRVWNLRCAYNPSKTAYRFSYVFYNKRGSGEEWPKTPDNFNENDWVRACSECPDPDHLVPCVLYGFDALKKREESQKAIVKEMQQRMSVIQTKLRSMMSFFATSLHGTFEQFQQNATAINQKLMRVVEIEEVQHSQGTSLLAEEQTHLAELEQMKNEITRPGVYLAAIRELKERITLLQQQPHSTSRYVMDHESFSAIVSTLNCQQDAIEALERYVKLESKKLSQMEESLKSIHQ